MTAAQRILIIDDDEIMRDSCSQILLKEGYLVKVAKDGLDGLNVMKEESFDLVLLDLKMPVLGGMEVLKRIKEIDAEIVVIVVTGFATVESAVEAMKLGAYDFLPKPFTSAEFRLIINRALEKRRLALENMLLHGEIKKGRERDTIVGQSDVMLKVIQAVKKIGPTDSTVLITGESGTGKELVARAIHANSNRKDKPFITVDCCSLVESLFESELFGHVRGSFTGATATKHGRFELANGGSILFDEIGNISTNIQAKLLRAIQEREITKVGSNKPVQVDVRIIAATNQDLKKSVDEKTFRDDLYYRLSVVPIHLPPLRERREDILLLADYFVEKYVKKRGKNVKGFDEQAKKILCNYNWPGNVRELENAIERAIVLTDNDYIQTFDLFHFDMTAASATMGNDNSLTRLEDVERDHILKILRKFNYHRNKTAEALGIDRKTLRLKMKKYGIEETAGQTARLMGIKSP